MTSEEQNQVEETTTNDVASGAEPIAALQQALAEQQELAAKYLDQAQRTAAEFSNYRRRQERDQAQQALWANANLLQTLLPVLDDLQRALKELPTTGKQAPWAEGVRLVERKMRTAFENAGVKEIAAEPGQPFDPNEHEAVIYEESTAYPEGHIVEAVRQGYRLGERVLRPAMVRVAKAPATAAA